MYRILFSVLSACTLFHPSLSLAQDDLVPSQQLQLVAATLEWNPPADIPYKLLSKPPQAFQACHFAAITRKPILEVRYWWQEVDSTQNENFLPHIKAGMLAVHLAANKEDSVISSHSLEESVIVDTLQADWAGLYTFMPKDIFSDKQHCQLLALFQEGKAMGYVFLLFDDPPATLPQWMYSLRFTNREHLPLDN